MIQRYRTIAAESQGAYKDKGSKFLAYAYPVQDLDGVQTHLQALRKEHHQARHHCYAYLLGPEGAEFRTNDAGEPRHSAGDPILGQIRSLNITNILVVVVRYFGGTKLGMGGLIQAYKEAANRALSAGYIVEKEICEQWILFFEYPDMNEVMRLVKELALKVIKQEFHETCRLEIEVPVVKHQQVKSRVEQLPKVILETLKRKNQP